MKSFTPIAAAWARVWTNCWRCSGANCVRGSGCDWPRRRWPPVTPAGSLSPWPTASWTSSTSTAPSSVCSATTAANCSVAVYCKWYAPRTAIYRLSTAAPLAANRRNLPKRSIWTRPSIRSVFHDVMESNCLCLYVHRWFSAGRWCTMRRGTARPRNGKASASVAARRAIPCRCSRDSASLHRPPRARESLSLHLLLKLKLKVKDEAKRKLVHCRNAKFYSLCPKYLLI